ncbi:MAG TPA: tetratricopeptide repeat protein [Bryobacteraceae bacterium]|nr:tetratricopeptide repeat protein [Bryobacteraceae bacterium]
MSSQRLILLAIGLFLLTAVDSFPQSASPAQQIAAHASQAQQFLKNNRPDLAAREYAAIVALDANNLEAHTNLGVLFYFNADYAKAAPQLRAALKLRPDLWKIEALLGMAEKRLGQIAEATADLEKAFAKIDEQKLKIESGMQLIEIYYASHDLDKAAAVVSVLRQIKPTDPDILYAAHKIYADQADETMLSLAMASPESPRMRQMMGDELARQGNIEGAIRNYRDALKADPHLPGVHFRLAEMLNNSSGPTDRKAAEKEYMAALVDDPRDAKSETRLGEIAFGRSDLKGASAHFSKAVELQPDDPDANLGLAKTLMSMQDPKKAAPYLERAAKLDPYNAAIHFRLASLYRETGRAADADREIAEFKRLRAMKDKLTQVYHEMRLKPGKQEEDVK